MNELIKRLEAAEAGSRELDVLIADAILGPVKSPYARGVLAHYTTSLDAALTLVPDGWFPSLIQGHDTLWLVEVQTTTMHQFYEAPRMRSPALALCIAAIKARDDDS